jgi:hypothetical protein
MKRVNFWIFAVIALVALGSTIGAAILGLAAFANGSDAGQWAALVFEVASLVVLVSAAVEMDRAS